MHIHECDMLTHHCLKPLLQILVFILLSHDLRLESLNELKFVRTLVLLDMNDPRSFVLPYA